MPAFAEDDPEPESKVLDRGLLGASLSLSALATQRPPTPPTTFPVPQPLRTPPSGLSRATWSHRRGDEAGTAHP